MDETNISPLAPQPTFSSSREGGAKKFILPIVIVIVLAALIFGGATLLRSRSGEIPAPTPFPTQPPTPIPSPTPEVTVIPTKKLTATPTKKPTPAPTKEASSSSTASKGLTLRVLNGSGEAGKAAVAADFLKALGYDIGGTGNADSFDFDKATITIKSSKSDLLAKLKTDLATKYAVGTTSATLASSETVDAIVIVGKN